jgi:hypothetical protein
LDAITPSQSGAVVARNTNSQSAAFFGNSNITSVSYAVRDALAARTSGIRGAEANSHSVAAHTRATPAA